MRSQIRGRKENVKAVLPDFGRCVEREGIVERKMARDKKSERT